MDKNMKVELKLPDGVASVGFEVDDQVNSSGGTVSLNMELFDKDGEWVDNITVTYRGYGAYNHCSAVDYADTLRSIADGLNKLCNLDRKPRKEVYVLTELYFHNGNPRVPSVLGVYPSEGEAQTSVRARLDLLERNILDAYEGSLPDYKRSDADCSIWCKGTNSIAYNQGWELSIHKAYYNEGKE